MIRRELSVRPVSLGYQSTQFLQSLLQILERQFGFRERRVGMGFVRSEIFRILLQLQLAVCVVAFLGEAARVLVPGGRFCVCITHPLREAGMFDSREPDAPFRIRG